MILTKSTCLRPCWTILILIVLYPLPGRTEERKGTFREHSEKGARHYRSGDFDAAVASYTRAYEIRPAPILLFNIAQAHRLAGRGPVALSFYERFLLTAPEAAMRHEAERHIAALRAPVREVAPAPPPAPRPAPPAIATAVMPRPAAPRPRPLYRRAWFWGMVSGIVAAGVVAGVTAGVLTAARDEVPPSDLGHRTLEF